MSQQVVEGLYAKLTASQGAGTLYEAVGGRIYDTQGPQGVALPHLVFLVVDNPVGMYFSAKEKQDVTVQCDLYGTILVGGEALGDIEVLLYNLLHGSALTVSGHQRGVVTCKSRGVRFVEEDSIRIMDQFRIEAVASS